MVRGDPGCGPVHLHVVVPQAAERGRDEGERRVAVLLGPVPVVAAVGEEPARPRRHVDDDRGDADRDRAGEEVLAQHRHERPADADGRPSPVVPPEHEQAERDEVEDTAPLAPASQAEGNTRCEAPRTDAERRARLVEPHGLQAAPVLGPGQGAGPDPVAVDDEAAERREDAHHQHDVEVRRPAHHQVQPVEREQQPGHRAEQGRAQHPPHHSGQDQHAQRPDQGHRQPPAPRRDPDEPLARGDHPLRERGVHHEGGVAVEDVEVAVEDPLVGPDDRLLLGAEAQHPERVLGVVLLVDDDRVRSAEVDQAQHQGQRRHGERSDPAPPAVVGHRRAEALPEVCALLAREGRRRPGRLLQGRRHRVIVGGHDIPETEGRAGAA